MRFCEWINPWGALKRAHMRNSLLEEDFEFLRLEKDRIQDRMNAVSRDLQTATLRTKMQKEEIVRLTEILNRKHTVRNPKTGRFVKKAEET